jgi:hypothetical protein
MSASNAHTLYFGCGESDLEASVALFSEGAFHILKFVLLPLAAAKENHAETADISRVCGEAQGSL